MQTLISDTNTQRMAQLTVAIEAFAHRRSVVSLLLAAVMVLVAIGCGGCNSIDDPSSSTVTTSSAGSASAANRPDAVSGQNHAASTSSRNQTGSNQTGRNPSKPQPPAILPALNCDSWLNGQPSDLNEQSVNRDADKTLPTAQTFGRVTVVDVFAPDCVPCHREMPRFVQVASKYQPQGVQFVSLAAITRPDDSAKIEHFVSEYGITWPVGCCSAELLDRLAVSEYPTVLVYNARREFVWWSQQPGTVEQAIERAIEMSAASDASIVSPNEATPSNSNNPNTQATPGS